MNQPSQSIATLDTKLVTRRGQLFSRASRMGRLEAERSMRAVTIVMVHEHSEDLCEVRLVQDQPPVETLGANRPHEPLRIRNLVLVETIAVTANDG